MCYSASSLDYAYTPSPQRHYCARYENSWKARIVITGPCGEERVMTVKQASDLMTELARALAASAQETA